MKTSKLLVAAILVMAIAVPIAGFVGDANMPQPTTFTGPKSPFVYTVAPPQADGQSGLASLERANAWLNSAPLTAADLRGKVVLIDFWTYTCINWLRQLPYVRAWAEKYKNQGLVVIGVHAPEFPFERNIENVRRATNDLGVAYPVAVDNDFSIWRAFRNQYWPALYFIDAQGRLRRHHFGEGDYEQSERTIQQLLAEAGAAGVSHDLVHVEGVGVEASADWARLRSPETYVSYERGERFASRGGLVPDKGHAYAVPARLGVNSWALSGEWIVKKGFAAVNKTGAGIAYRFHARDLHLVMGPSAPGTQVHFRVRIDGKRPGAAHGIDVDDQGNGTVSAQRLYQLIRQQTPIADRLFEIEFLNPGAEVYAFTFG